MQTLTTKPMGIASLNAPSGATANAQPRRSQQALHDAKRTGLSPLHHQDLQLRSQVNLGRAHVVEKVRCKRRHGFFKSLPNVKHVSKHSVLAPVCPKPVSKRVFAVAEVFCHEIPDDV